MKTTLLRYGAQLAVVASVLVLLTLAGSPGRNEPAAVGAPAAPTAALFDLPMHFEPASDRPDREATFLARGNGYAVCLNPTTADLALRAPADDGGPDGRPARLRVGLAGADPQAVAVPEAPLEGKSHYLKGDDPAAWRRDVPHFGRIRYRQVYPGVDVVFYGNQGQLEYDFEVSPAGDPGAILLEFQGTDGLSLDASGNLVVRVADRTLVQRAPAIYQETPEGRQEVTGRYVLQGRRQVRFQVGAYGRGLPLVIDPVLDYASYLGGPGDDAGYGVAVGPDGSVYITGVTRGVMPTVQAFQASPAGDAEAFIARLAPDGGSLVFATYLGGTAYDQGFGIKVDTEGNVYVTGETRSSDFPLLNAMRPTLTGYSCAFVTQLSADGSGLVYSTYLGGSDYDRGLGIDVDASGCAYVTGYTYSGDFCGSASPQSALGAASDAFVVKLTPEGARVFCTYLCGSQKELGYGIAVDGTGNVHVARETRSDDFPVVNALQPFLAGKFDAFVAVLDASGTAWKTATYLGGQDYDQAFAVDAGPDGATYVTGRTYSADFPTLDPVQGSLAGYFDAFVVKTTAAGIAYATFLGGSGYDQGNGIGVDSAGRATVAGESGSSDFPTVDPVQAAPGGGTDVFVARLGAAGASISYATLLGGGRNDQGLGLALDQAGNACVTGRVGSYDFPLVNPIQDVFGNGGADAFVLKVLAPAEALPALAVGLPPPVTVECASPQGTVVTLSAQVSGATGQDVTVWWEIDGAAAPQSSGTDGSELVYEYSLGAHSVRAFASDGTGEPASATTTVTVTDTTPPVVQIVSPMADEVYVSTDRIEVTYTAEDNHDTAPAVSVWPANPVGPPLAPGPLTIRVTATDASGNAGTAEVAVQVDALAAKVAFEPEVLNVRSNGTATVKASLPPDLAPWDQIDAATVTLVGPLGTAVPVSVQAIGASKPGGKGGKGKAQAGAHGYVLKFDRADLAGIVQAPVCALRLTGSLPAASPYGAAAFEGSDEVVVKADGEPGAHGRKKIALSQNVPNPFNPSTQIAYELHEAGDVTLVVHNVLGQSVRVLVKGQQAAGAYRVAWNGLDDRGRPVSTGTYIYRLSAGGEVAIKRMLLVR